MININLLPPELKLQRIVAKRNATLIGICIVTVLIVIIVGIIGKSLESTVEAYLSSIKNNLQKDSTQLDQYQEFQDLALLINNRWQITQELEKNHVYWSQVLQELSNCVPVDIQFENLTIDSAKSPNFVLQGNTITERDIVKFKEKLEDSTFFKNVSFKSSNISDQSATQEKNAKLKFTLEFDLEKNK